MLATVQKTKNIRLPYKKSLRWLMKQLDRHDYLAELLYYRKEKIKINTFTFSRKIKEKIHATYPNISSYPRHAAIIALAAFVIYRILRPLFKRRKPRKSKSFKKRLIDVQDIEDEDTKKKLTINKMTEKLKLCTFIFPRKIGITRPSCCSIFVISPFHLVVLKMNSSNILRMIETIYVGGGTPTALEADLFKQLLDIIKPYSLGIKEYTFEANPESLTDDKIVLLREYGVNRISLGVQSTNDNLLKKINRAHRFSEVQKVVASLKNHGFNNINVDLILGLPNATKKLLSQDLENVLALGIQHTLLFLTLHPHTVLFNQGFRELSPDQSREYYDLVEQALLKHGFIHYEVSNYSLPGFAAKHNFAYWRNEQYYGVGLGAAGYLGNVRYKNTLNLEKYLKGMYIAEKEQLSIHDCFVYQVMLNLRTVEGLSLKYIKQQFTIDLYKEKKKIIDEFIANGYLMLVNENLIPTYQGMMILDTIILQLI